MTNVGLSDINILKLEIYSLYGSQCMLISIKKEVEMLERVRGVRFTRLILVIALAASIGAIGLGCAPATAPTAEEPIVIKMCQDYSETNLRSFSG